MLKVDIPLRSTPQPIQLNDERDAPNIAPNNTRVRNLSNMKQLKEHENMMYKKEKTNVVNTKTYLSNLSILIFRCVFDHHVFCILGLSQEQINKVTPKFVQNVNKMKQFEKLQADVKIYFFKDPKK